MLWDMEKFYDKVPLDQLLAAALTASTTVVLCVYAKQTTRDFTGLGGALSCCLWLLIAFGIEQSTQAPWRSSWHPSTAWA